MAALSTDGIDASATYIKDEPADASVYYGNGEEAEYFATAEQSGFTCESNDPNDTDYTLTTLTAPDTLSVKEEQDLANITTSDILNYQHIDEPPELNTIPYHHEKRTKLRHTAKVSKVLARKGRRKLKKPKKLPVRVTKQQKLLDYRQIWNPLCVVWYRCGNCTFRTVHQARLGRHICDSKAASLLLVGSRQTNAERPAKENKSKPKPSAASSFKKKSSKKGKRRSLSTTTLGKWFPCNECEFKTQYRESLKRHKVLRHKSKRDPSSVAWHECDECDFKTVHRRYLQFHKLRHRGEGDADIEWHYCDTCDYKTHNIRCFNAHRCVKNPNVEWFECADCDFKTVHRESMKRHQQTLHAEGYSPSIRKRYKCDVCSFSTYHSVDSEAHKLSHDPNVVEGGNDSKITWYDCKTCEYKTTIEKYFKGHKCKNDPNNKWILCDECGFKSIHEDSIKKHKLTKHVAVNNPESITWYQCDQCEYKTFLKARLKMHQKKHGAKKNPKKVTWYYCPECDYKTTHAQVLGVHKKRHKKIDIFAERHKCRECKYSSTNINKVENHYQRNHTGPQSYLHCDKCDYKTTNKANLNIHFMGKHAENKEFKCGECGYETANKYNYANHQSRHEAEKDPNHSAWIRCDQCDYKTLYKNYLRMHLFKHSGGAVPPSDMFTCDECGFKTIHKQYLRMHKLDHAAKRSPGSVHWFGCEEGGGGGGGCEFRTVHKYLLKRHVREKHSRPILCDECGEQFSMPAKLRAHRLSKHVAAAAVTAAPGRHSPPPLTTPAAPHTTYTMPPVAFDSYVQQLMGGHNPLQFFPQPTAAHHNMPPLTRFTHN